MNIYWIEEKNGQKVKCGPSTVADIISRLQLGQITEKTLSWHQGCEKWLPLKKLPALADYFSQESREPSTKGQEANLPPLPEVVQSSQNSESSNKEQARAAMLLSLFGPSPMQRFMARMVDISLYAALYMVVVNATKIPFSMELVPMHSMWIWLPLVLMEGLALRFFGTTAGKALFGIRILAFTGKGVRLSTGKAMGRSFYVFVAGLGFMLVSPPLILLAMLLSYFLLRSRGVTTWDANLRPMPTQVSPLKRGKFFISSLCVFFCAMIVSQNFLPWMPAYLDEVEKQSPELAAEIRQRLEAQNLIKPAPITPDAEQPD